MEDEQDFINYLFEKRENDSNLKASDNVLKDYSKTMTYTEKELLNYINKVVNPRYKERLEKLIEKRETSLYDYFSRENQLFYKSGFADAFRIILSAILFGKGGSI